VARRDLWTLPAGVLLGWAVPTPWGAAAGMLGLALQARTARGEPCGDALRAGTVGFLWAGLALRWVRPALVDFGVDGAGWAAAAMVAWTGLLRLPVGALAGLALRRGWSRPVAWALAEGAGAAGFAAWAPLPLHAAAAWPGVAVWLWPARVAGIASLAAVAGAVAGMRPRAAALALAALTVVGVAWPRGEGPVVTVLQPGIGALEGGGPEGSARREAVVRDLVAQAPPGTWAMGPESAWPRSTLRDLPGRAVLGLWDGARHVLVASRDGEEVGRVAKRVLTPLTEVAVAGFGPSVASPPGHGPDVMALDGVTVAPLLCFEDLSWATVARVSQQAPDVWLLAANDAWTDGGPGTRWHRGHAAVVAASTGRPVVRPTTTGISAVLDPVGRPVWSSEGAPPGPLAATVQAPLGGGWRGGAAVSPWVGLGMALLAALGRRVARRPQDSAEA
jgi:apolipoprotein N-acyltransferase